MQYPWHDAWQFIQAEAASRLGLIQALWRTDVFCTWRVYGSITARLGCCLRASWMQHRSSIFGGGVA
jgi:hypothetical protein